MPQLDSITFFNQIFWVFIFFYLTYYSLLKNIIPTFSKILKLRIKLIRLYTKYILSCKGNSVDFLKNSLNKTFLIINK